jgi:hypothetical protein
MMAQFRRKSGAVSNVEKISFVISGLGHTVLGKVELAVPKSDRSAVRGGSEG